MLNDAPNLNYLWSSLIIEELQRSGVDTFCICPGSRSAPLTMAVASGNPARHVVHLDERGAAFHALGHAKASGLPVVFICTSGTAVANALPAVVEASMSHVPLILLTADRPPEARDTGANQTIVQPDIFGEYVRWSCDLPCPDLAVPPAFVLTTVDQAVHQASRAPKGPVHLNCMFREPLAPTPEDFDAPNYTASLASWFDGPFTQYGQAVKGLDPQSKRHVLSLIKQTRRGLLLVGELSSFKDIQAAKSLAWTLGWPVLPDVTSNLRLGFDESNVIHHYDLMLQSRFEDDMGTAQVLLHVGGPMTSKNLLRFIEATPSRMYIRVADHPFRLDPAHLISHRVEAGLTEFAGAIESASEHRVDEAWVERLRQASRRLEDELEKRIAPTGAVSEIAVMRHVTKTAPEGSVLFLGNSLPIREADSFGALGGHDVIVAANRGASGIDGNIATASGHANARGVPVTAVIGDLAALHDINSLALVESSPAQVILVILNNDGGGIFSFLPISDYPEHFERYFGTPHGLSFQHFAKAFDIDYKTVDTIEVFRNTYEEVLSSGKSAIIEVQTERMETERLQRRLTNGLIEALDGMDSQDE